MFAGSAKMAGRTPAIWASECSLDNVDGKKSLQCSMSQVNENIALFAGSAKMAVLIQDSSPLGIMSTPELGVYK